MERMKSCLVTGASGFMGRVLCDILKQKNIRVRALLRTAQTGPWDEQIVCKNWSEAETHEDALISALDNIDTIFFLSGIAHVSGQPATLYDQVNRKAALQLYRLAAEHHVKRFVYVSSVKVVDNPLEPYGFSKHQAEQQLLALEAELGMHLSILRPALVYGPGVKGNLLSMIKAIDRGWFPPIPEIHNQRSMVSVQDVAHALIACAENPVANRKIYTVSDGVLYSTRQLYDAIRAALGLKPRKWAIPRLLLEFPENFSRVYARKLNKLLGSETYSADLIKAELGWTPTTDFYSALKGIVAVYDDEAFNDL